MIIPHDMKPMIENLTLHRHHIYQLSLNHETVNAGTVSNKDKEKTKIEKEEEEEEEEDEEEEEEEEEEEH
jgi:hypothetical protein